jgi:hypothetical protein
MMTICESCKQPKVNLKTALVGGIYYGNVCPDCLGDEADEVSSNAAGYDRRRGYEDNAQDTVQPYDANGPNSEFARLYPNQAKKVFTPEVLERLKRKM